MRSRTYLAALAASLLIGAASGCGGGGQAPPVSGSSEQATVTGSVTVNGQPAAGGQITFDPTNINRPDAQVETVEIGADGSYSLTTLAGENSVTVQGPLIDKDPNLEANRQVVTLNPGTNTVPIALP